MRIIPLPSAEGDVVAREEQFGCQEGEFVVSPGGEVLYRHPWDERVWFAGRNLAEFREAVAAWNRYGDEAATNRCDDDQQQAVARLLAELSRIGLLIPREDNVWRSLLDQARDGQL